MITPFGFGTGPRLNQAERQPIKSNQDENNYGWQQMLNGQYNSVRFTSWRNPSQGISTSTIIIRWIPAVSMLIDFIIPWLPTKTAIYPRHWSWVPAPCCAMLSWSGKRTKVFVWKLPSQSWKLADLIPQTTWIIRTMLVRTHPVVLQ